MIENTERILNCLSDSDKLIQLPKAYNKYIGKISTQLKKIICYEEYKFIDYFKNFSIKVSTYEK